MKQRVLFLCTHNSARSQMAQGLLNWLAPESYDCLSAGTHPTHQHPLAIEAMAELGINIVPQGVHALDDYIGQSFDLVITVCDQAAEECPVFPGEGQQLHWGFADPSRAAGTKDERLGVFRHTRDLILLRLRQWLAEQEKQVASDTGNKPVPSVDPPRTSTEL
jgi:arsenate reductase (thioredoxin)